MANFVICVFITLKKRDRKGGSTKRTKKISMSRLKQKLEFLDTSQGIPGATRTRIGKERLPLAFGGSAAVMTP